MANGENPQQGANPQEGLSNPIERTLSCHKGMDTYNEAWFIDPQSCELIEDMESSFAESPALISRLCEFHRGIGADGIILLRPSGEYDFNMRYFNSDGSEAEMCGNGVRGVAKFAADRGLVKGEVVRVETEAGLRRLNDPENAAFAEIGAIEERYAGLWRFYVFVPEQVADRTAAVAGEMFEHPSEHLRTP